MDYQDQNKRRRQQKISQEQKEIYCSFMEQNPLITKYKNCDASVQSLWESLGVLLNSTCGAHHTVDEWKKVFDNWRYAVTYKLRLQKAEIKRTGGGSPKLKKDIEKLEERAMASWGRIVVDGHRNVSVAGCSKFEPTEQLQEPPTDQPECHIDEDVLLDCNDVEFLVEPKPKPKRQRRSTTQTLDDDFIQLVKASEEQRQKASEDQTEKICSKLDELISSVQNLNATIEKLAMIVASKD